MASSTDGLAGGSGADRFVFDAASLDAAWDAIAKLENALARLDRLRPPERRQMPQFNLTDEEYRALSDFLLFVGSVNTQQWPPNDAG